MKKKKMQRILLVISDAATLQLIDTDSCISTLIGECRIDELLKKLLMNDYPVTLFNETRGEPVEIGYLETTGNFQSTVKFIFEDGRTGEVKISELIGLIHQSLQTRYRVNKPVWLVNE